MGALGTDTDVSPSGRSPSCRTHPGSPARSQRNNDRCWPPVLIAGKEVIGRHLHVQVVPTKQSQKQKWLKGCIVDFSIATGQHKVRYAERGQREDEWLSLDRTQFGWLSEPGPGTNPTFHVSLTPVKDAAVDHAVAVFWPGMSKWYKGRVKSYDAATGQHKVCFHDGYVRDYHLKHEAIMWLDVPGLASREDLSRLQHASDLLGDRLLSSGQGIDDGACRSGRSGPSRRSVGGRRQRAADSGQSGSPATRCQAAHPTGRPGRQPLDIPHKQGACAVRNGDAMHPVIIIKGLDASGACSEVCQPMAHPAVSRLKDGETGSSASPAAQVDGGARRADSEAPSLAATSARGPPQLRQQESRLPAQVKVHGDAGSQDVHQHVPGISHRDDDASSCARCSDGTVAAQPAPQDTLSQRPLSATTSGVMPAPEGGSGPAHSGHAHAQEGPCLQSGLKRIKVRVPPSKAGTGRSRATPAVRRRSGSLEPTSARRRFDGSASPLARSGEVVVGARIGIWWPADEAYYRGKITSYDSYHKRSKVRYDDDEEEWLALPRQRFICMLPRARSAGCTPQLLAAMQSLGAANVSWGANSLPCGMQAVGQDTPHASLAPHTPEHPEAPQRDQLVGWRLSLLCPGTGELVHGEVVGWDPETQRHLVLYDDGEHEHLLLCEEHVTLHAPQRGLAAQIAPGLPEGEPVPKGKAAVGWRIGVYWKDDQKFYHGEVESFETATGRHVVLYDDGEREPISLSKEKVKWVLPPNVHASEEAMSESDFEAEEGERPPGRHSTWGRGRKRTVSPSPEGGRPHKVMRTEGGFDLRRTGPVPHPALAPGGVRQLGSTCELRSRHGHRLALRSLRIFLPAACSPLLPLGLALPPARAEASGEEPGLPTPCRQAAAGWPEAQAHSAGPWGRTTPQDSTGADDARFVEELAPMSGHHSSATLKSASPEPSAMAPATSVTVPYSLIPPTQVLRCPAAVPMLHQAAPALPVAHGVARHSDALWPQRSPSAEPLPTVLPQCSRSASGSPTAMPGFLNLFGSARRAAAQGSEACGSQPAPVPPAPQLDKPALQSCSGESLGQRDGGAPTLHKLAADVGSGGSLPIPDTPAAGEELRGRLLQASCSLTTSALLHLQPRPGSAGSEEGGCSGTSTDIAAASCQQSHLARDSQVLGGAPAAGGHPFKLETHGGVRASVVAVPGPGLGALGKWAASAMAQGMPEQDGHSKQQEEEEGGQALSGGLVSPVHGTIEVSRCSPISDLPVSKRPQAIKAAAK